jgi:hypothetical protein
MMEGLGGQKRRVGMSLLVEDLGLAFVLVLKPYSDGTARDGVWYS